MKKINTNALGVWGEEIVADFAKKRGHDVIATRWRSRYGEIDIISTCKDYLCFIEVKLRKDKRFAEARSFVTQAKQEKLRLTAELYLAEHPTKLQPRFDVVEIYAPFGMETKHPEIIYWENAF